MNYDLGDLETSPGIGFTYPTSLNIVVALDWKIRYQRNTKLEF